MINLYLAKNHLQDKKFTEVIVDLNKIATIRCAKEQSRGKERFFISMDYNHEDGVAEAFNDEASLRVALRNIISQMGGNPAFADSIQIRVLDIKPDPKKEFLETLLARMKESA